MGEKVNVYGMDMGNLIKWGFTRVKIGYFTVKGKRLWDER